MSKLIEFNKLPIVDVIGLIDYYNLTPQQTQHAFRMSEDDIASHRQFLTMFTNRAKSVVIDYAEYADYILGVKTFNAPEMKKPRNKLNVAFKNIPQQTYTLAKEFCEEYDVSIVALKQIKRFDPVPFKGKVQFKTINGVLMVGRFKNVKV